MHHELEYTIYRLGAEVDHLSQNGVLPELLAHPEFITQVRIEAFRLNDLLALVSEKLEAA